MKLIFYIALVVVLICQFLKAFSGFIQYQRKSLVHQAAVMIWWKSILNLKNISMDFINGLLLEVKLEILWGRNFFPIFGAESGDLCKLRHFLLYRFYPRTLWQPPPFLSSSYPHKSLLSDFHQTPQMTQYHQDWNLRKWIREANLYLQPHQQIGLFFGQELYKHPLWEVRLLQVDYKSLVQCRYLDNLKFLSDLYLNTHEYARTCQRNRFSSILKEVTESTPLSARLFLSFVGKSGSAEGLFHLMGM